MTTLVELYNEFYELNQDNATFVMDKFINLVDNINKKNIKDFDYLDSTDCSLYFDDVINPNTNINKYVDLNKYKLPHYELQSLQIIFVPIIFSYFNTGYISICKTTDYKGISNIAYIEDTTIMDKEEFIKFINENKKYIKFYDSCMNYITFN